MIRKITILLMLLIAGCSFSGNAECSGSATFGDVRTFVVTGENFKYVIDGLDNPDMIVNEGDVVRIEFTSVGGFHDFVVDEFGATSKVNEGGSTFVQFTADKVGEFEYYCSVGSHRAHGMKGRFIVQ